MRFLIVCVVLLLVACLLIGSGSLTVLGESAEAVPASVVRWWPLFEPLAYHHDVDPLLVAAVIAQESGGDPNARSPAGANGLMQVLNGPFEPQPNVTQGVQILARHLQTFKDVRAALAAYNAGPGVDDEEAAPNARFRYAGLRGAARRANVPVGQYDRYAQYLPAETRRYVPAVMALYQRFGRGKTALTPLGAPMRWPLDQFQWRPTFGQNIGNGQPEHSGEDFIAPCGTPVKAAYNGKIVYRGCLYGNCRDGGAAAGATGHGLVVVQQFEPKKFAVYAHLSDFTEEPGAKAGEVIGHVGLTGFTRGCHLHYAIWQGELEDLLRGGDPSLGSRAGDQWLDPKKYLPPSQ